MEEYKGAYYFQGYAVCFTGKRLFINGKKTSFEAIEEKNGLLVKTESHTIFLQKKETRNYPSLTTFDGLKILSRMKLV